MKARHKFDELLSIFVENRCTAGVESSLSVKN